MKFQNNMNHPAPDPHFRVGGMGESKFQPRPTMKRNDNDVFKRRLKQEQNENTEKPARAQQQWFDRQPSLEKVPCDSTSSLRNNFAFPLDPQEYRQTHKLATPDKIISSITPAEFLKLSRNGSYSDRPMSTATSLKSGFLEMPGSRNSGSLSRHSARGKKRMLSVSPICSEILDLHEIIRTSPNSLVAFVNNNDFRSGFISRSSTGRNSSAASHVSHSSYGHLSPAPISQPVVHRQRNHFATPDIFNPNNFTQHPRKIAHPPPTSVRDVSSSTGDCIPHGQQFSKLNNSVGEKPEEENFQPEVHSSSAEATPKSDARGGGDSGDDEEEGESKEDFRCQWKECSVLCESQTKLVEHVNEHIQNNKKDCTCYWETCSREEKPFKAMYMLVVHVRRHTGEKPHKCHYEGCDKAYSRLENLKTHLRSHTGERPYVCEIPGCTKAFSNASDRAKHQNRTHSSIKQYGCKVEGCPKRYTDPSSLRKHMKTVHGALPQPNKKIKVDHKQIKKEPNVKIKVEETDDPQSPNKRQTMEECKLIKHSPTYYNNYHDGGGSGGSPSYHPSSGMVYNHGGYTGGSGGYSRQQPSSNNVVSSTSHDIQRTWNQQGDLPTNFTNNDPLNLMDDSNHNSIGGGNLQLEVQAPTRNILPNLHKPIDPSFANRRLSNDSIKNLTQRRGSDVSTGSVDSSYMSGTETYNGSRRDSSHSTISYLSGGRRSATLPSPLPSRNLSPGRINATVIEGEVLDNYNGSNLRIIQQNQPQPPQQQDNPLRDVTNAENNSNNNVFSRVSSGYGSQQTTYFPAKTPTSRLSPTPSREQRRASEGRAIRVSDAGFNLTEISKKHLNSRRASDPVKVRSVVEAEPPRRGSFSYYSVLPTPQTMQSMSENQIFSKQQQPLPPQQQQSLPVQSQQQQQNQRFGGGGNLMVMPQNINTFQQQGSPQQASPQHQQMVSEMSPVVYAQPDSTNMVEEDDLAMIVDNFNVTDQMQMSPNIPMMNQQQMLSQQNSMNIVSSHNQVSNNVPRLSHIQTSPQISSANFMNNTFASQSSNMVPRPPNTPRNAPNPPLQQQQQQQQQQQINNNIQGNYDFTLQWTNNHFGAAKQQVQQMEPDSTVDNNFENLMVNGMASLNTSHDERPKTNMAINRMDSLLTSYAEENKYFEYNTINRYQ